METLSALHRQMHTAEELRVVVKSMKAMAASSITQYEAAVAALADYERTIALGLQVVLGARTGDIEVTELRPEESVGAVVFGSDQGMVGGFNERIVEHAIATLDALHVAADDRHLVAVGDKVQMQLDDARQHADALLHMPTSMAGVRPTLEELMVHLDAWRRRERIGRILLFHNVPVGAARYQPQTVRLVPVASDWLRQLADTPWTSRSLPLFDAPWEELFADLIQEFLYASLFRAIATSLAAENASRLASMEAAEHNIEDKLEELTGRYQELRQRSITAELLDIVAGAEAVGGTE